jgi:hypothetical protein
VLLREVVEQEGRYGKVYVLGFEIVSEKFKGCRLNGWLNKHQSGHGGRLWACVKALTGKDHSPGSKIDLELLKGKECFIRVEQKNGGNNAVREYIPLGELEDLEQCRGDGKLQHSPRN